MEELINTIKDEIYKVELHYIKESLSEQKISFIKGMSAAYNRIIFEIEINKDYYEQEILKKVKK